jgi:glutathione S-transferase
VLIHNGRPICESQIILQYIDEVFVSGSGGDATSSVFSLLPADPHERAVARFWAAYLDNEIAAPWDKAFRAGTEEERAEWMGKVAAAVPGLERGLRECTDGGSKGCFFGGAGGVGYMQGRSWSSSYPDAPLTIAKKIWAIIYLLYVSIVCSF